jgi:TonB family protein
MLEELKCTQMLSYLIIDINKKQLTIVFESLQNGDGYLSAQGGNSMRRILLASALLSPLFLTAAAVASSPATDAADSTSVSPVSTGVVFPHVISTTDVELPNDGVAGWLPNDARVVLQLNLDEKGNVQDVQVVDSIDPELNDSVVSAVRQFRFSPAKLDNQAIPSDMTLTVLLRR